MTTTQKPYAWTGELLGAREGEGDGGPFLEVKLQRSGGEIKYPDTARTWDPELHESYRWLLNRSNGDQVTVFVTKGKPFGNGFRWDLAPDPIFPAEESEAGDIGARTDDYRRSKEEMRRTEADRSAATLLGGIPTNCPDEVPEIVEALERWSDFFYERAERL